MIEREVPGARKSVLATATQTSAVLLIVLAVATGLFFAIAMRNVISASVAKDAARVARAFAAQAQFPMLVGDEEAMKTLAGQFLASPDVLFAMVTDREGKTVRAAVPGFPLDQVPGNLQAQPESVRRKRAAGFDYVEATCSVAGPGDLSDLRSGPGASQAPFGPALGMLRVGISVQEPKRVFFRALTEAMVSSLLCLGFILWFRWSQLQRLLDPLRYLARFTAEVGEGSLDSRARICGGEEIASLAESFNGMLDRLAATLVSRDLAERADKAKSEFLAGLSHELRTPLNAIIGYSELLDEECRDRGMDVLRPDLMRIRNAGRVLLDQMNDLLDYAKLEADRAQIKLEQIAVSLVIREVADTIESMARKNGNILHVPALPEIYVAADRLRLRQCLLNVVANACKFTENGTVSIAAEVRESEGKRWCQIEVRDTGIGIAPDKFEQLFEPFVQLEPSATRRYGGTGLGLAISRKYCRLMGGDIGVQSELGRGSTFTLSLPASLHEPPDSDEMNRRSETLDCAPGKTVSR